MSWSAGGEAAFGRSETEMLGRSADVIFTPEDRAAGQPEREVGAASRAGCGNDERWHQRADGTRVFMNGAMRPLPLDAEGRAQGFIKFARDETEQRRADQDLRESEAHFRNMADHTPVMMWLTDPTGSCTYLNRRWHEFTDQTPQEAEGFGWLDATHPDDKERASEVFLAANAAREPSRLEYRLRRADGSPKDRFSSKVAVRIAALTGREIGVTGADRYPGP